MKAEVYRYTRDASVFIVVPKGVDPPAQVRISDELEIEAHEWQLSRELDIDPTKVYVGLDVETAVEDLKRQQWHLGSSTDSSR